MAAAGGVGQAGNGINRVSRNHASSRGIQNCCQRVYPAERVGFRAAHQAEVVLEIGEVASCALRQSERSKYWPTAY